MLASGFSVSISTESRTRLRGAAEWKRPSDIAAQFTTASVLKSCRVVFNIKGNEYRLVAAVAYRFGAVYVKFVGTHREYDRIDANTVEMS